MLCLHTTRVLYQHLRRCQAFFCVFSKDFYRNTGADGILPFLRPLSPYRNGFCIHSIQNCRKRRREIRKSARILKKLLTFHPLYGIVDVPVRVLFLCSKSLIRFREAKNTGGAVLCVQRSLLPVQSASSATTIRSKTRRTIPIVLR